MKKTTTTITKEYNDDGALTMETTETVIEEDSGGYIYPQHPLYPGYPFFWQSGQSMLYTQTNDSATEKPIIHDTNR